MKSRLLLAALPVAAILALWATPAEALTGCTRVDGSQYTSAHCTGSGGAPFIYARHFCVTDLSGNGFWQNGAHVGAGGYSSAGPCGGPITNRTIVQTSVP